jgi:glycerate kinase
VIAPDSFKESMAAATAAEAMERGVREVFPEAECVRVPLADGGEGLVAALAPVLGAQIVQAQVRDPFSEWITAEYGLTADGLAIMESASAIGLGLIPASERNIWAANTAGVADLIRDAVARGARRLLIGIGGTATNDCGAGMLSGLGTEIFDALGEPVAALPSELGMVAAMKLRTEVDGAPLPPITVACDVNNPLLGEQGATAVFGPQKGATAADIGYLEDALAQYAACLERASGKAVRELPGAGAAGGLGAAFLAIGAELKPGIEIVLDTLNVAARLQGADYVLTGEGALDAQTGGGKAPFGMAALAAQHQVPCVAFVGQLGEGAIQLSGFTQKICITPPNMERSQALIRGPQHLQASVAAWASTLVSTDL